MEIIKLVMKCTLLTREMLHFVTQRGDQIRLDSQ